MLEFQSLNSCVDVVFADENLGYELCLVKDLKCHYYR